MSDTPDLAHYRSTLAECRPFVVASAEARAGLDLKVFGRDVEAEGGYIDPQRVENSEFLERIDQLDRLTFGPGQLRMPRWTFYDVAEMSGAVVGLAQTADRLPQWIQQEMFRGRFDDDRDRTALVPLSMAVATPAVAHAGAWVQNTLCSIQRLAESIGPPGLRALTQVLLLELLRVKRLTVVTQWRSSELDIHGRFAPLRLRTAYTPAHTDPASVTSHYQPTPERIAEFLRHESLRLPRVDHRMDANDTASLHDLQAKLEGGLVVHMVSRPRDRGGQRLVDLSVDPPERPREATAPPPEADFELLTSELSGAARFAELAQRYETYVLAPPDNCARFDLAPLGVPVQHIIDPTRNGSQAFIQRVLELDRVSFGGLSMPAWVLYDCVLLPAGIFGFGLPASAFTPLQRLALELPLDYEGLVPLAFYHAVPMPDRASWMAVGLASASSVFERLIRRRLIQREDAPELRGLGTLTKVLALKLYGTRRLFGATQWSNTGAIRVHARFGPLELRTAYTPAHAERLSFTYAVDIDETAALGALGIGEAAAELAGRCPPGEDLRIKPERSTWFVSLQRALEDGSKRAWVTGRPVDGEIPIRVVAT